MVKINCKLFKSIQKMKIVPIIVLIMMLNNCNSLAQKSLKNVQIEYLSNTRGFYKKIYIHNQMIAISVDRNDTVMPAMKKISDSDWKFLSSEYKKIKLSDLDKLKPPTKLRFHDGAAMADLKIIADKKTFETQQFDNGFPHPKIKKFVDKITALGQKK